MNKLKHENENSFFDENRLLHVKKGEYSENGPLFTAHFCMLQRLLDIPSNGAIEATNKMIVCKVDDDMVIRPKWFDSNPAHDNDENTHFSHDNMTGLYCLKQMQELERIELPTIRWNNRFWLHPRDTIFYSIMHTRKLAYLFLPIIAIMAWVSCRTERGRTSGKCMWWLRLQTLKLHDNKLVSWFGEKLYKRITNTVKKNHYMHDRESIQFSSPWVDVFSIYFSEADHPVNVKMREFYGI